MSMATTLLKTSPQAEVSTPKLLLAPMEGVVDALMRDILTAINRFDLCITEFVRVVDYLVPQHIFYKIAPELNNPKCSVNNTPIRLQLLGQNPEWMAENAIRGIELGSNGIDLNFGCPAKAVNKSKGGAVLLKTPETIYQIVKAVKSALGDDETTSVKIRLGFDDASLLHEVVDAIVSARADMLTIHARTKMHGYKPPAYWEYITQIKEKYDIPLVANGEIWSREDALRCQKITGTSNLMLGRGILALPNLANVIMQNEAPMSWPELLQLLQTYSESELQGEKSYYYSSRLKQWLRYLRLQYPEAQTLFEAIKVLKDKNEIMDILSAA